MPIISLYQATVSVFVNKTDVHSSMKKEAKKQKREISESDNTSFRHSIPALQSLFKKIMKKEPGFGSSIIYLEAKITNIDGSNPRKVDAILFGYNRYYKPSLVILEIKEWSGDFISLPNNQNAIFAGKIHTKYKDKADDNGLRDHPSKQASDYRWHEYFHEFDHKYILGAAYCFKCKRGTQTYKALYYSGNKEDNFDFGYDNYFKDCKLYTAETVNSLINWLSPVLAKGKGYDVASFYDL